jgi:hypothetical protein
VKTIIQLASENPLHSQPVDKKLWTFGEYAHVVIGKQYRHMVKEEEGVLMDSDRVMVNWEAVGHQYLAADFRPKQYKTKSKLLGSFRGEL